MGGLGPNQGSQDGGAHKVGQDERDGLLGGAAAKSSRWAYAIPVLIAMFLVNGFCVNIIPELMLAEFGERAIVIGTSFDCVAAIVSFGTVPLVGALSDHFGRRSMLTLCLVLLSLPVVPLVLSMSLWFNLALRILAAPGAGLVGIAFAYGADWLPEGERTRVFGLLSAAYQLTFMCAPYLGALVYEHTAWKPSIWLLALSITAVGVAYIAWLMPASPRRRSPVGDAAASDEGDWKRHANPVAPLRTLSQGRFTRYLAIMFSCHSVIFVGVLSTFPTYATEYIGFDKFDRALFQGLVGMTQTVAAMFVNQITRPLGERNALMLAFAGQVILLLGLSVAWGRLTAFLPLVGMLATGIITPTVCAMASEHSPPEIQGEVQGAMSGVQIVSEGTGPLIFAQLIHMFWAGLGKPGWAYSVGCSLIAIEVAAVLALPKVAARGRVSPVSPIVVSD